ncbi:MAG: S1 RNA-binding domain-containing protein [Candidatus Pacebacteria bacterium]|jgi:ribosomal protein S1|nr:S1 RNA-binding domain-containing protein [Candidatus Paceibacterota bacterium]|tara:strand:- start:18172 stop:19344 length:1173 start_codon:yes stop_codon:yes gene_type:complete
MVIETLEDKDLSAEATAKAEKIELSKEEKSKKRGGKKDSPMAKLLNDSPAPPEVGDLVEGPVIGIEKSSVFIDLHPFGTGIIYGREFLQASDVLRKVNIGDNIAAKVVDKDSNKEGYIELSLKEARQALIWSEAEHAIVNKTILELPIKEANKGGLILEWQNIQGFLPASQLKAEHYPRVEDADKDKILGELKKFVGTKLSVSIITADAKEGKLIFSEKDPEKKEKEKIIDKYAVGDVAEGEVTGIVDFGVFVKLEDGLEGLVHISEIEWGLVEDPRTLFSAGDKVKVKIIEIKDGKISLSIKALKKNPWKEAASKYKKDDEVTGVIIKYNKHGALASIEEGVAGLVHVSEFADEETLRKTLELGKTYKFKIAVFDPKEQKMTLSHRETN